MTESAPIPFANLSRSIPLNAFIGINSNIIATDRAIIVLAASSKLPRLTPILLNWSVSIFNTKAIMDIPQTTSPESAAPNSNNALLNIKTPAPKLARTPAAPANWAVFIWFKTIINSTIIAVNAPRPFFRSSLSILDNAHTAATITPIDKAIWNNADANSFSVAALIFAVIAFADPVNASNMSFVAPPTPTKSPNNFRRLCNNPTISPKRTRAPPSFKKFMKFSNVNSPPIRSSSFDFIKSTTGARAVATTWSPTFNLSHAAMKKSIILCSGSDSWVKKLNAFFTFAVNVSMPVTGIKPKDSILSVIETTNPDIASEADANTPTTESKEKSTVSNPKRFAINSVTISINAEIIVIIIWITEPIVVPIDTNTRSKTSLEVNNSPIAYRTSPIAAVMVQKVPLVFSPPLTIALNKAPNPLPIAFIILTPILIIENSPLKVLVISSAVLSDIINFSVKFMNASDISTRRLPSFFGNIWSHAASIALTIFPIAFDKLENPFNAISRPVIPSLCVSLTFASALARSSQEVIFPAIISSIIACTSA